MTEWKIGNVRITKVIEHEVPVSMDGLLVGVPADVVTQHPWLRPNFVDDDGNARLSIHALVVDTGERRILVDTCVGDQRQGLVMPPMPSDLLESLAAAGYAVEDIDTVLCTHLHFDHVGWNTRLVNGEWKVTFPNARYLFGRVEWEHWDSGVEGTINIDDTVRPVIAAGQADLVETDHRVCDEVRLIPTPGHTPGHVSVVIESGGERAVITGDMAHHPVQFARPEIWATPDTDSTQSTATRRAFLADRVADGALVIGTHFATPTAGHVRPDGDGWELVS